MRYVYLALIVLACCAPAHGPVVTSEVEAACARLRALGCPEGNGAPGIESCALIVARRDELHPLPLACWSVAQDVPAAKGCGSLRCVP